MYGILIFFHLLVSVVLVLVVLVQQPQKGGMASIMGGSGDSMFGGGGAAPFMAKLTTGVAAGPVAPSRPRVRPRHNRRRHSPPQLNPDH
jgi:protein translocase SecG subunit